MSDEDGDVGNLNRKRRMEETFQELDLLENNYHALNKLSKKTKYSQNDVPLNIPGPAGEIMDLLKRDMVHSTQIDASPLTPTDFKEFDKKPWKEIINDLEDTISIEDLNKVGYLKKISKKMPLIIQKVLRYETDAYVNFIDPTGLFFQV
jgi:hypothetical protein